MDTETKIHNLPDITLVLDSMVDMICMINEKGIILYSNSASFNILGYTPSEMIGYPVLNFVRQEDQARSEKAIRELNTERDLTYFTNRFRTKQGGIVEVEWYNTWDSKKQVLFGIAKNLVRKTANIPSVGDQPAVKIPGSTLSSMDLFKGIEPADLISLEEASSNRLIKKGRALRFPQFSNKYAYLLSGGIMKTITTHETGKDLIKFLVKPGNLVGDIPILEQYERPSNYAVALEDSLVTLLDMTILTNWYTRYDFFRIRLKEQVASRIHKMEDRLSAVIHMKASERVADFLVNFVLEFGTSDETGWTAKNFLTHADVAQLCSVSRQKVSQSFSTLKMKQFLHYDKNWIQINHHSPIFAAKGFFNKLPA